MTASIYAILAKIGFHHPLHPALTHIPMGMVMGCFFFSVLASISRKPDLLKSCLHCTMLALFFMVPTVLAGIMDWQHRYGGEMRSLIVVKMILAGLLTVLLLCAAWFNKKGAPKKKVIFLYLLCLACAIGLGFSGGELVYGS